ncbi:hypothetical protein BDV98DRAFT_606549 [Pterulicium gracile]|uniref:DUF6534 domain-containing protein n=1 Tax=Pterulicium gracile TaxID=1884261 RepID=A0A5C3QEA7_9AGAR|nr:hypothetical protein BDV98DRAFT_606549 [Pterula gracilis]
MPHVIRIRAEVGASPDAQAASAALEAMIQGLVGPPLIGTFLAAILLGIYLMQVYIYFKNFYKDRKLLKLLVSGVCFIEIVHMAVVVQGVYEMSVLDFMHPERFYKMTPGLYIAAYILGVTHLIIPIFLVYRIRVLTQSVWLVVFLGPLAIARGIISIALSVISHSLGSVTAFSANYTWLIMLSLSLGVLTDLLLSGVMVLLLHRKRKNSISKETGRVMVKLILYTVESGAITALVSLMTLIVLVAMPKNYAWVGFLIVVPKVYANTLMASLNGRLSMKPEQASVSITDFGFGSVPCTPPAGVNSFVTTLPKGPRTPIQINKASEVYMQRDGPDSKTEEHEQFADEQLELKAMGNR